LQPLGAAMVVNMLYALQPLGSAMVVNMLYCFAAARRHGGH